VRWTGTAWSAEDLFGTAGSGQYTSLALTTDGNLRVSYVDYTAGTLKYAQKNGSWSIETMSNSTICAMVLDLSGNPMVAYRSDVSDGYKLRLIRWNGSSWDGTVADGGFLAGNSMSLVLDRNGNPAIAYRDGSYASLKLARWNGASWDVSTVDNNGNVAASVSLAIDRDNNPHIAYDTLAASGEVRYAKWNGAAWEKTTLDTIGDTSAGSIFGYVSLALDRRGQPRISYYDLTNQDLKCASYKAPPTGSVIAIH
jgi:hypothetical protein